MNLKGALKEREIKCDLRVMYGDFGEDVFKKEMERKRFFKFCNEFLLAPTFVISGVSAVGLGIFGAYSEIWRGLVGIASPFAIVFMFGVWSGFHEEFDRRIVEKHIRNRN